MKAEIISIGHELITGQSVDTNAAWLAAQLSAVGGAVTRHVTVGDDVATLCAVIRAALASADLVVMTGGLGPTADDLTREAVAAAIGEPLEENQDALQQITAFFTRWQRPMPDSNRVQARLPRGCRVVPNPRGTAPGIAFAADKRRLFALPGVPAEMKAMFRAAILPLVTAETAGSCTCTARLLCFGTSEARIGEAIADLMVRGRNPLIGTTASEGVISVRIHALGADPADAQQLIDADVATVRQRLGRIVFGADDDSLEAVVGRLLTERSRTVATAESCTGGLLAKRLTDVPGSSAYFLRGLVTYSNEAKTDLLGVPAALIESEGAVSDAVARAMATGCREMAGADYAIGITGIAGPAGGSPPEKPVGLVFVALAGLARVDSKRLLLGEHLTRAEIRDRSCKIALNLLRLELLGESPEDR